MQNHGEITSFLWDTANLVRDAFRRGKYQDIILPFTVLRRVDSVLAPTKEQVLGAYNEYESKLDNLDPLLTSKSGRAFYNTSRFTFEKLVASGPDELRSNMRTYIGGFSANMREVLQKFDFPNTLDKLEQAGLLFQVTEHFAEVNLHPGVISNEQMGLIFEELIRKFNEALDENPGEHFTPREVVRLMTRLVMSGDQAVRQEAGIVRTIYDPCCGTGGMLTAARDRVHELNTDAETHLFGQEVNPETYAVCKSDLFLKSEDGRDAENIAFGSTLAGDEHRGRTFHYQLANPPYGKRWSSDKQAVKREAKRGHGGRFGAGTPRISDGQLLFLQHMLNHLPEDDGRIAIIMNGSPLFTGDAASGESEIRRWILENDWLAAIIALPEQLFYNTGIATYVWVLSGNKPPARRGKVQLIDATALWTPMRKSLGDKRRFLSDEQLAEIVSIYEATDREAENGEAKQDDSKRTKVFDAADFGYRKVRIERPLRVNLRPSEERIERLWEQTYFAKLDDSTQQQVAAMLRQMPGETHRDYVAFRSLLNEKLDEHDLKLRKKKRTDILTALSEKDPDAEIARDTKGRPISDTDLRGYERVPLTEDVDDYFEREVQPHVPDAWIDEGYTDEQDGEVGRVGYEINFNRYFYEYEPPRPLDEIEADIQSVEEDVIAMIQEVTA
jgi:type I restriction enzyme M protein